MSFDRFKVLAEEKNLFSYQTIQKYIKNVPEWDLLNRPEMLHLYWQDKKDVITLRFIKYQLLGAGVESMIDRIDSFVTGDQIEYVEVIWLIYKFLDDESKRIILEAEINEILPIEIQFLKEFGINKIL